MSYATTEQFVTAFSNEAVELTNLDNPAAEEVDIPKLQQALDAATAEIDLYLQVQYALPLPAENIPPLLSQWCVDITRYRLDRNQPADDVRDRYDDAIKALRRVASGELNLFQSRASETSAEAVPRDRQWSPEKLSGFGLS